MAVAGHHLKAQSALPVSVTLPEKDVVIWGIQLLASTRSLSRINEPMSF